MRTSRPKARSIAPRSLPVSLPRLPDVNTDETAKAAIRPKIAQIRGRLKKLEAALSEASAASSRDAFQEQTAAATAIQAYVRGANRCLARSHVPLRRSDAAPETYARVDIMLAQVVALADWRTTPQLQTSSVSYSHSHSHSRSHGLR